MSKKQQLIDFVLGNDFIAKPSLRNQFQLMLNDAIHESQTNAVKFTLYNFFNGKLSGLDADEIVQKYNSNKNKSCLTEQI
jgi:hypothetical protein